VKIITIMIRIDINDPNLTLRDRPTNWGTGVWLYNGVLFTGIVYEYFPNTTQFSSESEYVDGILDGRQVEYWPNGKIKDEYFEKYDGVYGSFKEWNEQGVLITHQIYDSNGNLIEVII
jgi:antitoxin component YwqK of YwqJK toxin-antitoxin module